MIAAVTATELRYHYRLAGGRVLKAVDGVGMQANRGQTFGIIGESGCGKSTLGRILAGMVPPTAGAIRHGSVDPFALAGAARRTHRRRNLMIHQDPDAALNPRMTILQSVREPLDIGGELDRKARTDLALDCLEQVGLGVDHALKYPHELSGGQKQRVNIARALTLSPDLIVCDEVVSSLDVSTQADVLNLLADIQAASGLTYVFISHNLGVVAHISDWVAVMYLGRFVELGTPEQLVGDAKHPYTQALLSAEPVPLPTELRPQKRIILHGEVPNPISPPSGCRFRTRCPLAQGICAEAEPEWRPVGGAGHFAACHFAQ